MSNENTQENFDHLLDNDKNEGKLISRREAIKKTGFTFGALTAGSSLITNESEAVIYEWSIQLALNTLYNTQLNSSANQAYVPEATIPVVDNLNYEHQANDVTIKSADKDGSEGTIKVETTDPNIADDLPNDDWNEDDTENATGIIDSISQEIDNATG